MIPGNELILTCPYCQAKKIVMTLISGNSGGSIKWSDGYTIMPMYPQNSEIQQCAKCEKFFWINEQSEYCYSSSISVEPSLLIQSQWSKALEQFQSEKYLDRQKEVMIRLHMLWSFNHESQSKYNKDDFENNCNRLLILMDWNGEENLIMSAEIYRELGQFNKCLDLLCATNLNSWGHEIRKAAIKKVSNVFVLRNASEGYCIFI